MSATAEPSWTELLEGITLRSLAPSFPSVLHGGSADMHDELDSAGLGEFARLARSEDEALTFVVNDGHRFTETFAFLSVALDLIDEACAGGSVPVLRILVAQGSHRASDAEKVQHEQCILGSLRGRFGEIRWHDGDDSASHASVGGYEFNAWMAEGGFYVGCGSVEPHYFAGATGAHKTLSVGVMSRAAIEANHAGAMSERAGGLLLDGNPVHRGVVSALAALEVSGARLLALNQVVVEGVVAAVCAGPPVVALERALPVARECYSRCLQAPVDLIVARAGAPLDRDLYQSDKGIKNTEAGVRDGGVLILESLCTEGLGIDHFMELLRAAPTHREALAVVAERGYRLGDHKAVRLRALSDDRGVRIALVSRGIDRALGPVLGMEIFTERAAAATWAQNLLAGRKACGLVVEDAGNLTLEVA